MTEKIPSISPAQKKILSFLVILLAVFLGFCVGRIQPQKLDTSVIQKEIKPEISLVKINKISGDTLETEVSGPVRILWGEDNLAENDGVHAIPLSQIPNENDQPFLEFPYTANTKTMKFYPSDSYFARGVEVRYRRFFKTKEEAISTGFAATKGVK